MRKRLISEIKVLSLFLCVSVFFLSLPLSLSVSLLASCFVTRISGGRWAKKGNRRFGPRLFSLLIGLVFLAEQAGVHLDVTYQRQAQGCRLAFPHWLTVKKGRGLGREGGGGSQQILWAYFICEVYCKEAVRVCDFIKLYTVCMPSAKRQMYLTTCKCFKEFKNNVVIN